MVASMGAVAARMAPSTHWRDLWYKRKGWLKRRAVQLKRFPLCAYCLRQNKITPATVVDHVTPHHGDYNTFVLSPLQSLCKPCHDRTKHVQELKGFSNECDINGNPIDPRHPWNSTAQPDHG
jgi:5-methylcytosine-specific restriction protein A